MKLTEQELENNKNTFCQILSSIERKEVNIKGLIEKLESSGFFTAPASTKYHDSIDGGLCDHSLNVYYNLRSLVKNKHLEDIIDNDSIIICGLLHDMSKMNIYEKYFKNVKKYSEYGTKHDNGGNFDWEVEESYKVVDAEDRFLYGNHEETSEYMIRHYIPLKLEESVAILTHHGGTNYDSVPKESVFARYERYPLATLLHVADMISMFVDERKI